MKRVSIRGLMLGGLIATLLMCQYWIDPVAAQTVNINLTLSAIDCDANLTGHFTHPGDYNNYVSDLINLTCKNQSVTTTVVANVAPEYPIQIGINWGLSIDWDQDGDTDYYEDWPGSTIQLPWSWNKSNSPESVNVSAEAEQPVGGIWVPLNKLALLTPYIGLTILLAAAVVTVACIKNRKKR